MADVGLDSRLARPPLQHAIGVRLGRAMRRTGRAPSGTE